MLADGGREMGKQRVLSTGHPRCHAVRCVAANYTTNEPSLRCVCSATTAAFVWRASGLHYQHKGTPLRMHCVCLACSKRQGLHGQKSAHASPI